jgi:hypothetical protein
MTTSNVFYPELNQAPKSNAQIVLSYVCSNIWQIFYSVESEVEVNKLLGTLKIAQKKRVEYVSGEYSNPGNFDNFFVASITQKAAEKLQDLNSVAFELLLD